LVSLKAIAENSSFGRSRKVVCAGIARDGTVRAGVLRAGEAIWVSVNDHMVVALSMDDM